MTRATTHARSAGGDARRQPPSPRPLTGGESSAPAQGQGGAIVDYLTFTFFSDHLRAGAIEGVKALINELEAATGFQFYADPINGKHGFTDGYQLYGVGFSGGIPVRVPFCLYLYGGESQHGRICVSMSGTGCGYIRDWYVLHRFMRLVDARITRVDLAVDFMDGEFNLDEARRAYLDNQFATAGNKPLASLYDDLDTGAGKTLSLGNRKNGKTSRIYEKGKQLGNPDSPWTRFEVELHNRDRVIPMDVVIRPSDYWVGQYKISNTLIDAAAERIRTLTAEQEISMERYRRYLRLAYGRGLHIMRLIDGDNFDAEKLLRDLEVQGVPRRLEKTALHFLNSGTPAPVPIGETQHAN
jgi:phage replication initiation protein